MHSVNQVMYDEKHRLKNLLDIEKVNIRVKKKCPHISFNPLAEDYQKLGKTIWLEIRNMMERLKHGQQPFFCLQTPGLGTGTFSCGV
jgi:hypothetical protein